MAKKSLKKKSGVIAKEKFSMETSKMYVAAGIICFHILPLAFIFMGEAGQQILMTVFLATLNPLMIFCICLFHAFRLGFCFKFPLIMTVLSAMSVVMYHDYLDGGVLMAGMVFFIVYAVLCFVAELFGGFLKKLIGG